MFLPHSQRTLVVFAGVGTILGVVVLLQMVFFHFYLDPLSHSSNNWMAIMTTVPQHRHDANTHAPLPFQGTYLCRNLVESYGAAWLTTKSRFLALSQHPYKKAMRNNTHHNWTLANVHWGKPDSMEVGSELVLKATGGALRTIDALEFAVEHLSGYSKLLRHDQKQNGTDWKTHEMVRIVQERIHEMQKSKTTVTQLPNYSLPFADRVLVVLPFHAATGSAIFGGVNTMSRGKTGKSYTETRNYFFQATLTSLSSLFSNIAVFVENQQDYRYCEWLQSRGFPLIEINLLSNIPDNRFLPEATVYEVERRMVQPGSSASRYDEFDYVYFSEADQILRLRPHQLPDLLAAAADSTKRTAVITPHRLAPIPHPKDFDQETRRKVSDAVGTSKKKFGASKFLAMEQKPVVRWYDSMDDPLRCCMDPRDDGGSPHQEHWVPFSSTSQGEVVVDSSPRPPITLLDVGPYHVLNGDADLWTFKWRTCRLERHASCA